MAALRDMTFSNITWTQALVITSITLLTVLIVKAFLVTRRPGNFPPGPATYPFLGNLPSIPLVKSYKQFAKWSVEHGPILGLKAGPTNLVILQDPVDIHELFDKRGHKYAGRPYNYIALNHIYDADIGQILLFQHNDRLLKRWKRPARWFLSQQGIEGLMPVFNALSARCVRSIMDDPAHLLHHLRLWSLGTPIVALTGQSDVSGELLRTYFYRQQLLTGLLEPGKTPPVDFVPPLRWMPAWFARWKREARFVRKHQDAFYGELMEKASLGVQKRKDTAMKEGKSQGGKYEAVMIRLLEEGMGEREVKWLAGGLLDAAFDTTSAAVMSFVVAMAGHSEHLIRAQEEVDEVCGGKMPRGEDTTRMPFLRACMMETFRWRPPTPLSLPHVADSDDVYKGFLIPEGTNIFINSYAMLHNPNVHANPHKFDPTRYLSSADGAASPELNDELRSTWIFGAGRRKCAGDQYIMTGLMVIMARLVWSLDMRLPEGTDLSLEAGFDGALTLKPKDETVVEFSVRMGREESVRKDAEYWEDEMARMLPGGV